MMIDLTDETGITLAELLAVILLIAIVTTLVTSMVSHIFTIRNVQAYKVKTQAIANNLYNELNAYSNQSLVNQKTATDRADTQSLGESGKYRDSGGPWTVNKIVKLVDADTDQVLDTMSPGVNHLKLVTYADNQDLNVYQTPSEKIKMKVHFVKNKYDTQVLKRGENNYRDSFSVDTKVYVIFYKGEIEWTTYISDENAPISMDALKEDKGSDIVYTRVFEITYRDDAKSAGEVAGNGRW